MVSIRRLVSVVQVWEGWEPVTQIEKDSSDDVETRVIMTIRGTERNKRPHERAKEWLSAHVGCLMSPNSNQFRFIKDFFYYCIGIKAIFGGANLNFNGYYWNGSMQVRPPIQLLRSTNFDLKITEKGINFHQLHY